MAKELYLCIPCNFEYEHLYFPTAPSSLQPPVPPCPLCGKELGKEDWDDADDYSYVCSSSGGCGLETLVEYKKGEAPPTRECFQCHKPMTKKFEAPAIMHEGATTKGASIDVQIGRDANQQWERIFDRTEQRNKLRKEAGTNALSMTGVNEYKPIKGAKLQAVAAKSEIKVAPKK